MMCLRFSNWSRLLIGVFVTIILTSCQGDNGASTNGAVAVATAPTNTYTLIWSDEFNAGTRPSVMKWRMETGYGATPGWGNDEWQLYTNSVNNAYVQNGNLVIAADCPTGTCGKRDGSITSARLQTKEKFTVKYGKIQARIMTPSGKGMWPAFWMLGDNIDVDGWPKSGEIDIMEMHYNFSDIFTTHATVHWWDDSLATPAHAFTTASKTFPTPLTDGFHTYEVDWDENRIVGKIDGLVYFIKPIDAASMSEFLNNYFLILNVAVGGTLGGNTMTTSWPQKMLVDWVRVYQKQSNPTKGIYSETSDAATQNYVRIINSAEFGGNSVTNDPISTAVSPFDGSKVLAANYSTTGPGWSGMIFKLNRDDWSNYGSLVFSLDASAMVGFNDLEVKIEDARGGAFAKSVMLSAYTPVVTGNWSTYTIPLADLVGLDFTNVAFLGFYNPVNTAAPVLGGVLYFDDIHLTKTACATNGILTLDAASYPANAAGATVAVTDLCGANKHAVVAVDNGVDTVGLGMVLDSSGAGSARLNFGATDDNTKTISVAAGVTLGAGFTDANGTAQTTSASITAAGGLPLDINGDGIVYIYANNQAIQDLTWGAQPAGDYLIDAWGSGTVIADPLTPADPDFTRVLSMTPGTGWGASTAVVAFISMTPGIAANYTSINFKVKGLPAGSVDVMFSTAGAPELRKTFQLSVVGTAIPGTTGWYDVSIPLSNYPDVASYKDLAIIVPTTVPFLLTDVGFK